MIVCKSSE